MKRLLIIGAGGHGAVVAEAAAATGRWTEIQFLDDDPSLRDVLEFQVIGTVGELRDLADDASEAIVAIGNSRRRLELCEEIRGSDLRLATVIHPTAILSKSAVVGDGAVMFAGSILNAKVELGIGCIVNTGATVDHDCRIGAGAHICPGANLAGDVAVGECARIGIGSAIKEGTNIGRDAIVGAGSAVVEDVGDDTTVGGCPARILGVS